VAECQTRFEALRREHEVEAARRQREHEEICRQRGLDGSARSALVRAYILGRSGTPICEEVLHRLMSGVEGFDVVGLDQLSRLRTRH
jgi:hypothetical protein